MLVFSSRLVIFYLSSSSKDLVIHDSITVSLFILLFFFFFFKPSFVRNTNPSLKSLSLSQFFFSLVHQPTTHS